MVANPVFSLFTGPHGCHTESSHFRIIKVKLVCSFHGIKLLPHPRDKDTKHVCILWKKLINHESCNHCLTEKTKLQSIGALVCNQQQSNLQLEQYLFFFPRSANQWR
jgi:hypothetical protein